MPVVTNIYKFESPLKSIDPNCGHEDWIRVGRAIYHATKGSDYGLAVFDLWSSQGDKYKGKKEIEVIWRSFRTDEKDPFPVGTLGIMAAEAEGMEPEEYVQINQEAMMQNYEPKE